MHRKRVPHWSSRRNKRSAVSSGQNKEEARQNKDYTESSRSALAQMPGGDWQVLEVHARSPNAKNRWLLIFGVSTQALASPGWFSAAGMVRIKNHEKSGRVHLIWNPGLVVTAGCEETPAPRSRPCTNWSGRCMYGFGEIEPKMWVPP